MFENWDSVTVTEISLALYVQAGVGKAVHENRPTHGFVLNCSEADKVYYFSDGRVLKTRSGELFYLPKGSSYRVKSLQNGDCYAINFDVAEPFSCEPFVLHFRNNEKLFKSFRAAEKEWRMQSDVRHLVAKKAVYDIMLQIQNEQTRRYQTDAQYCGLTPALERISSDFTENGLSVAELSALCGISEVYFRKLFFARFGVSPKEYIISLRMGYAKQLLEAAELSVGEVAMLCGYAEASHFSREFSAREGCSPSEYRRRGAFSQSER